MVRKIILLIALITPILAFSQKNDYKSAGVSYATGKPNWEPTNKKFAEIARDSSTGYWWVWDLDSLDWYATRQVEYDTASIAPTHTPGRGRATVLINAVDSMYHYRSGAWRHLNAGGAGSGDDWGSDVVNTDATLTGDGTVGDPLKVDTTVIGTVYDVSVVQQNLDDHETADLDIDATNELQDLLLDSSDVGAVRRFELSLTSGNLINFDVPLADGAGIYAGSGTTGAKVTTATVDSIMRFTATNDVSLFDVNMLSTISNFGAQAAIRPDSVLLRYFDIAGTNKLSVGPLGVIIQATGADRLLIDGNDAAYTSDVSSGFGDQSLINKIWADSTYIGTFNDYGAATSGQVLKWTGTRWGPADDATAAGSGEGQNNVGANIGAGTGLYAGKSDTTLQFKTLQPVYGINITSDADEVFVEVDTSEIATLTDVGAVQAQLDAHETADLDIDATNELQDLLLDSAIVGSLERFELALTSGNMVYFDIPQPDGTGTDDQTLTIDSTTITGGERYEIAIEDGNSIFLDDDNNAALTVENAADPELGTTTSAVVAQLVGGTGIDVDGDGTDITFTNTAPDLTVVLNNGTGINVTGTYPDFTINSTVTNTDDQVLTIDSTTITGGERYEISIEDGNSIFLDDDNNAALTVENAADPELGTTTSAVVAQLVGGTGVDVDGDGTDITFTNTAPDLTVVLNNGTGINVTGTYPDFTINSTVTNTDDQQLTLDSAIVGSLERFELTIEDGGIVYFDIPQPDGTGTDDQVLTIDSTTITGGERYEIAIEDGNSIFLDDDNNAALTVENAADPELGTSTSATVVQLIGGTGIDIVGDGTDVTISSNITDTDDQGLTITGSGPTYDIAIDGGSDVTIQGVGITLSETPANTLVLTADDASATNEIQTIDVSTFTSGGNLNLSLSSDGEATKVIPLISTDVNNDLTYSTDGLFLDVSASVGDGNGIYSSSNTVPTNITASLTDWIQFGAGFRIDDNSVDFQSGDYTFFNVGSNIKLTTLSDGSVIIGSGATTATISGVKTAFWIDHDHSATSGTAEFNSMLISSVINQTGSATGITRGIYINPGVTNTDDYRALEIGINSDFAIYQTGSSASNLLAGTTYIGGGATPSQIRLYEGSGSGTNYVGLVAATTMAASDVYTLPDAYPTSNGDVLSSTTTGVTSWITPTGGGTDDQTIDVLSFLTGGILNISLEDDGEATQTVGLISGDANNDITFSTDGLYVDVSANEVDGDISNELQTIANTSASTTHTATLSDSGGSLQLAEGTGITLTTTGTTLDGVVTIATTVTNTDDQVLTIDSAIVGSLERFEISIEDGNSVFFDIPIYDGSETSITEGTDIGITGTGTSGDPYIITSDWSEPSTQIVSGTGSGRTSSADFIHNIAGNTITSADTINTTKPIRSNVPATWHLKMLGRTDMGFLAQHTQADPTAVTQASVAYNNLNVGVTTNSSAETSAPGIRFYKAMVDGSGNAQVPTAGQKLAVLATQSHKGQVTPLTDFYNNTNGAFFLEVTVDSVSSGGAVSTITGLYAKPITGTSAAPSGSAFLYGRGNLDVYLPGYDDTRDDAGTPAVVLSIDASNRVTAHPIADLGIGADTDDQTIDVFSFTTGGDLNLSLEDDGEATQTVNLISTTANNDLTFNSDGLFLDVSSVTGDGNGIYGANGTIPDGRVATMEAFGTFQLNASNANPFIYIGEDEGITLGSRDAAWDFIVSDNGVSISNGTAGAGALSFFEDSDNGSNFMTIVCPANLTTDYSFEWPNGYGSDGQVLTTDGAGVLTWEDAAAGGDGGIYSDGANTIGAAVVATMQEDDALSINYFNAENAIVVSDANGSVTISGSDGSTAAIVEPDYLEFYTNSGSSLTMDGTDFTILSDGKIEFQQFNDNTVLFKNSTSNTTTVRDMLTLSARSTGAVGTGFGGGILFQGESSSTNDRDMARIATQWIDATDASRESAIAFSTVTAAGALTERVRIVDEGLLIGTTTDVAGYDLVSAGPIRTNAGHLSSRGAGNPSSTTAAAAVRMFNTTGSGQLDIGVEDDDDVVFITSEASEVAKINPDGTFEFHYGRRIVAAPATDETVSGDVITLTANETQAFGDVCYVQADGDAALADASAIGTAYALYMCTEAATATNPAVYLRSGIARDDTWAWTPGQPVYLTITGTTGNTLSQTAPSGTGEIVFFIGMATHADRIDFNPTRTPIELE